jgi:hypothetical protein
MNTTENSRRRFLLQASLAATALPLLGLSAAQAAAPALKKLPLDNPQAKALAYTENAATVKHASFKPGSNCANCQFFTAATGACTLFPGHSVAAKGWCSAWAKKA